MYKEFTSKIRVNLLSELKDLPFFDLDQAMQPRFDIHSLLRHVCLCRSTLTYYMKTPIPYTMNLNLQHMK